MNRKGGKPWTAHENPKYMENLIWGDSREVEYVIIWLDQMMSGSVIYLVDAMKEIKSK